jgi:hypothetical protein
VAGRGYPSALARFGVAQTKDGRKVGGRLNVRDVSFPYCQRERVRSCRTGGKNVEARSIATTD